MTAEPMSGPREPNPEYETAMQLSAAEHARQDILLKEQIADLERERKTVNASYETLNHEYAQYCLAVYDEARSLTTPVVHPLTGELLTAYLRQDETSTIHLDDWTHPETRRQMPGARRFLTATQIAALCNAPKVSSKKWKTAVEAGEISADIAAQVMEFGVKAGYIALAKPDDEPPS